MFLFIISTTITIKLNSTNQDATNQLVSTNAGVQKSLLGGIMDSLDANPKQEIVGNINLVVDGKPMAISLSAQVDFTTLTNPDVSGFVSVQYDQMQLSAFVAYVDSTLFVSCNNIKIKATISSIKDIVEIFKNLIDQNSEETLEDTKEDETIADVEESSNTDTSTEDAEILQSGDQTAEPEQQENSAEEDNAESSSFLDGISLDDIIAALTNPQKQIVDNQMFFNLNIDGICQAMLVTDLNYNIQTLQINSFELLPQLELTASVNMVADENLIIEQPETDDSYLDIEAVKTGIEQLFAEDYITANIWAAVYKDSILQEQLDSFARLNFVTDTYYLSANLSGTLNCYAALGYKNNTIYAILNDMYVKASADTVDNIYGLVAENISDLELSLDLSDQVDAILSWLADNYNSVLNSAVVSSSQIMFTSDLSGILGQTGVVTFTLGLRNGAIYSLKLSGVSVMGYTANLSVSLGTPSSLDININDSLYYDAAKVLQVVDLVQNTQYTASADLTIGFDETELNLTLSALADIKNGNYKLTIGGLVSKKDIVVTYVGGAAYVSIDDVCISAGSATISEIIDIIANQFGLDTDISAKLQSYKEIFADMSLQDLLDLFNISVGGSGITLATDLSSILEKTFAVDIWADYIVTDQFTGISAVINNLSIGGITISGSLKIASGAENISAPQNVTLNLDSLDVTNVVNSIINLAQSKTFSGAISVSYDGLEISGNYVLDISSGIAISANLNVCGLDASIYFDGNTIYANVVGLKVYVPINQIEDLVDYFNYLSQKFSTTTSNEEVQTAAETSTEENTGLTLEWLVDQIKTSQNLDVINLICTILADDSTEITLSGSSIMAKLLGLDLSVNIGGNSTNPTCSATVGYEKLSASLNLSAGGELSTINAAEYASYTEVIDIINAVIALIDGQKISLTATATIYEGEDVHYYATCEAQVEFTSQNFAFYADISVIDYTSTDKSPMDFMLAYQNGKWYADYNNLKLKIDASDLAEIVVMLLGVLGIDVPAALTGVLQNATLGVIDVDTSVFSALVPNINLDSPLTMLKYIYGLDLQNGTLTVKIDNALITNNAAGKDMVISVVTTKDSSGNVTLSGLNLSNVYTGVTETERFNLNISVAQFSAVTAPPSGNYIDLSGCNNLIKAVINTAELNYFHITGNLDVTILGINLGEVPVDIKIKLDENRLPEILISLPDIPVVVGVNKDTELTSTNSRAAYIYYYQGYVYFYRVDSGLYWFSSRTIEQTTKVYYTEVFDNILYYLQWVTGFSDSIMEAIEESLSIEHETDLGNVITSFTASDSKTDFKIVLNMYEITGDSNMGDMTISLTVVNNESTNNKDYIGYATFNLEMPFTSAIVMQLDCDDLALEDIGKELDFSSFYDFINSYSYAENEEWTGTNGSWSLSSTKLYTITFDINLDGYTGSAPADIEGTYDSPISLPTYSTFNYYYNNNQNLDVYTFAGWYTTAKCEDGTEFTSSTMPRGGATLYAKWVLTESYRTATFVDYYGNTIDTQFSLIGTALKSVEVAETLTIYSNSNAVKSILQYNGYFVDASGNRVTEVTETTTLYPSYSTTTTYNQYTLYINTGVANQDLSTVAYEQHDVTSLLPQLDAQIDIFDSLAGTTTTYSFGGWYTDSNFTTQFDGTMPSANTSVYAKWTVERVIYQRQLSVYDNEQLVYQDLYAVEDQISLPSSVIVNNNTQWYLDANYSSAYNYTGIMPDNDLTLYVRNLYTLTYTYYVKSGSTYVQTTASVNIYQGQTISLPSQADDIIEFGSGDSYYRMVYTFGGWFTDSTYTSEYTSATMPNANTTVYSKFTAQKQYRITFDTTWVKPTMWVSDGKIVQKGTVESVYVNEGETFNADAANYTTTAQYKYMGVTYSFNVVAWNTTGCSTVTTGATNTKSYSQLSPFTVNKSITLYAIWGK